MRAFFDAISRHAVRHVMLYVIVLGLGLQAFCTAFYDNFWPVEPENMVKLGWWQVLALWLKSFSFGIGIMVGYLIKPPPIPDTGQTNPPIPPKP